MPRFNMDQAFEQLQRLFAAGTPPVEPLLLLLKEAQKKQPLRYEQEWLPYLERQPLPTLQISTLGNTKSHLRYLPKTMPLHLFCDVPYLSATQAKALAAHPITTQIDQLSLYCGTRRGALVELVDSDDYELALKSLFIYSAVSTDPVDIAALSQSACLSSLRSLYVTDHTYDQRFDPILSSPKLSSLEHLTWSSEPLPEPARLDALLARSEPSSFHTKLSVEQDLRVFEAISNVSSLRALTLRTAAFAQGALKALSAPQWSRLTRLHFDYGKVDVASLNALLDSPTSASLRALRFDYASLEPAALAQLVHTDALRGLRELSLSHVQPTPAQLQSLLSAKTLPALEMLELLHVDAYGPELARALSQLEDAPKLKVLELNHCELTDEDVIQLIAAPWLQQVQVLSLEGNNLTGGFIQRALLKRGLLPNLTSLELARNPLAASTTAAVERLIEARPSLRLVDLRGAELPKERTNALDQHPVRVISGHRPNFPSLARYRRHHPHLSDLHSELFRYIK